MQIHVFSYKEWQSYQWPQEIQVILPFIGLNHIKGRDNILADSLLRLEILGLYEANDPKELGSEYGKSIFDTD